MKRDQASIQTERLRLREIDEKDTDIIVKFRSNPEWYRFFTYPHRLTAEEHLNWYRNSYVNDEKRIDWIAVDHETEIPTGLYNMVHFAEKKAEIGYLTADAVQGKGYTDEAVTAIVHWAKQAWGIDEVIIKTHRLNKYSVRFARRMGFVYQNNDGDFQIYSKKV